MRLRSFGHILWGILPAQRRSRGMAALLLAAGIVFLPTLLATVMCVRSLLGMGMGMGMLLIERPGREGRRRRVRAVRADGRGA